MKLEINTSEKEASEAIYLLSKAYNYLVANYEIGTAWGMSQQDLSEAQEFRKQLTRACLDYSRRQEFKLVQP